MIIRDTYGSICQHSKEDPHYCDGGDSAARMGIHHLHTQNEFLDNCVIVQNGKAKLVRNKYQPPKWNNPKETSRDQLIQFCVAAHAGNFYAFAIASAYQRSHFINKDYLNPAVRLYLYACIKEKPSLFLLVTGYLFMWGELLWTCFVKPHDEINQFCCLAIGLRRYGNWLDLLYKWHPNPNKNIRDYWGGWRDQIEIGEGFLKSIEKFRS